MTTVSNNIAPEVTQRLAQPDEIPASAARLAKLGAEHGWDYETYYSRGTRLTAKKASDNLTVRLTKGPLRLVGVWVDGAFSAGLVGKNGRQVMVVLQSRQLSAAVRDA